MNYNILFPGLSFIFLHTSPVPEGKGPKGRKEKRTTLASLIKNHTKFRSLRLVSPRHPASPYQPNDFFRSFPRVTQAWKKKSFVTAGKTWPDCRRETSRVRRAGTAPSGRGLPSVPVTGVGRNQSASCANTHRIKQEIARDWFRRR